MSLCIPIKALNQHAIILGKTGASNGAYKNARGRLRSFGLIEYRDGRVFAKDFLFLQHVGGATR